jgi:hypothetical protein
MRFLLCCFFIVLVQFSYGQEADTVTVLKQNPHSAQTAARLSTFLPGAGQVYNKQYWKVPVIYVGAGALIYSIAWNNRNYQLYKDAYALDSDTSSSTNSEFINVYSVDNLITLKDYYRRNRDLSAIGLVVLYAANIIDAYVYAQFFNFDVSDDLSMEIKPMISPYFYQGSQGQQWSTINGISLTFRLK